MAKKNGIGITYTGALHMQAEVPQIPQEGDKVIIDTGMPEIYLVKGVFYDHGAPRKRNTKDPEYASAGRTDLIADSSNLEIYVKVELMTRGGFGHLPGILSDDECEDEL